MQLDVDEARALAARLLAGSDARWLHVQRAARRAEEVAAVVGPTDRELLICAVWLHDIGYAKRLVRTGFHPLDGGLYLVGEGWPTRLAALVAHHSEARMMAPAYGVVEELARFAREDGAVTDALVYADLATGPDGRRMSLTQRLEQVEAAVEQDSPVMLSARKARRRPLVQAVERTEQRLTGVRRTLVVRPD